MPDLIYGHRAARSISAHTAVVLAKLEQSSDHRQVHGEDVAPDSTAAANTLRQDANGLVATGDDRPSAPNRNGSTIPTAPAAAAEERVEPVADRLGDDRHPSVRIASNTAATPHTLHQDRVRTITEGLDGLRRAGRCNGELFTVRRSRSAKYISITPHLRNVPIPACVGSDQKVVRKVSISTLRSS